MEYYTGDKILKKSNDVIIDRFIKWMIFNPKLIGMISIITLISIVQSIFLIIDIWNIFMIFFYLIISASSLMIPIIYLNDSIFGKRLYKEEKYRLEHNYHLKKITYYQAMYIKSFPEEYTKKEESNIKFK